MKQTHFKASITGAGKYLPKKILTNYDLEKLVDTNDEWIQTRTGIQERRIVNSDEATVSMSTNAVLNMMQKYNISANEIDTIIVEMKTDLK